MKDIEFDFIINKSIIPIIRNAWLSKWIVKDVESCLKLFEQIEPLISKTISNELLQTVIFPKLSRYIDQWDPKIDDDPIDTWILPWLPYLKPQLVAIFPNIRRKMKIMLKEWNPSDEKAYRILKPWYKIFDYKGWDNNNQRIHRGLRRFSNH